MTKAKFKLLWKIGSACPVLPGWPTRKELTQELKKDKDKEKVLALYDKLNLYRRQPHFILCDFEISENHIGGDDLVGYAEDIIAARDEGLKVIAQEEKGYVIIFAHSYSLKI